jgi:LysR family glycine cleavage system transcriptional activator
LPDFQKRHPDIHLHLHASAAAVDLASGTVDAAIRYGRGPYSGLVAQMMFRETFAPLCSPMLGIQSFEDLRTATLLHLDWLNPDDVTPTWERWAAVNGVKGLKTSGGISFSDDTHAIQAAIAGQGVVLASPAMARDELDAGLLTLPFDHHLDGHHYHFLHTGRGNNRAEVKAFGDWILAEVAKSQTAF